MIAFNRDPVARSLHIQLLKLASSPYYQMLLTWITAGVVDDPYDEFMIIERRSVKKETLSNDYSLGDLYWEQRYILRLEAIPPFLLEFKDKILSAGKYLNVVRECGLKVMGLEMTPDETRLGIPLDRWSFEIDKGSRFANKTLLDLLLKDWQLLDRLR